MRNKIIFIAFITAVASANTNIFIKNTTPYAVTFNDLTTDIKCPIAQNSATSIIVNSDYSVSCANKINENPAGEITRPLPHRITLTKDSSPIASCITDLPKNDILIYIKNTGTSAKPNLVCKNFPPLS